jgi:hypothetical protein
VTYIHYSRLFIVSDILRIYHVHVLTDTCCIRLFRMTDTCCIRLRTVTDQATVFTVRKCAIHINLSYGIILLYYCGLFANSPPLGNNADEIFMPSKSILNFEVTT